MYEMCLKLARQALEEFARFERELDLADWLTSIPPVRRGVFISIHSQTGSLQGSVGTFLPTRTTLAEEILHNAIAAYKDDRFEQVDSDKLAEIRLVIDILGSLEEVHRLDDLDPEKYGIVIQNEKGSLGWALPGQPHITSVKDQLALACQRGSIDPARDQLRVYRFSIEQHLEE